MLIGELFEVHACFRRHYLFIGLFESHLNFGFVNVLQYFKGGGRHWNIYSCVFIYSKWSPVLDTLWFLCDQNPHLLLRRTPDVRPLNQGKQGAKWLHVLTAGRESPECGSWECLDAKPPALFCLEPTHNVFVLITEFGILGLKFQVCFVRLSSIPFTLLHGQWVVCLLSGRVEKLIKWAQHDASVLLL